MNHPLCMGYRVSTVVTCAITHATAVGHDDHPYEGGQLWQSGDSIWQSGLVIRIATTYCSGDVAWVIFYLPTAGTWALIHKYQIKGTFGPAHTHLPWDITTLVLFVLCKNTCNNWSRVCKNI